MRMGFQLCNINHRVIFSYVVFAHLRMYEFGKGRALRISLFEIRSDYPRVFATENARSPTAEITDRHFARRMCMPLVLSNLMGS